MEEDLVSRVTAQFWEETARQIHCWYVAEPEEKADGNCTKQVY